MQSEEQRIYMKEYRARNRAKIRAKERLYWAANKDKKKAKDARSYAKNRKRRQAWQARYSAAHRREAIERVARWRKLNREKCNTISANRRAREAKAEGYHTTGEWEQLKIQYGFKCPRCGRREPEIKLTRDHIIPLARGGTNYIENIQPLCGKCNCEKWAKMPEPK